MGIFATEEFRFSNVVKQELWPEQAYCREWVVVNESTARRMLVGTVLGSVVTTATGVASAYGTNTGNGVMGAVTVGTQAKEGVYELVITAASANAGSFTLRDPDGLVVGTGTVGSAFNQGGMQFTLANGSTDCVNGDRFSILVTGSTKYKTAVETATDGSKVFAGIALENKDIPANTDTRILVLVRGPSAVSKGGLVLDSTYNDNVKKAVVYQAMKTRGIDVLETV